MDDQQRLQRNGLKVDSLYRAVRDSQAVELIPALVEQIIAGEMWREHHDEKTGETFQFDDFLEFIETHPPDGIGTKVEVILKHCIDHPVVLDMIDRIIQNTRKAPNRDKTTVRKKAVRNARQTGLRRLRLYAEQDERIAEYRRAVLAGEMSVNAALVAAGLKKPRITLPKDVNKATSALRRVYSSDEIEQLVMLLRDQEDRT